MKKLHLIPLLLIPVMLFAGCASAKEEVRIPEDIVVEDSILSPEESETTQKETEREPVDIPAPEETPTEPESIFQMENGKYEYIKYDPEIETLKEAKISMSGLSICSSQVYDSGIYIDSAENVKDFLNITMDVFKHPFLEDGKFEITDDRIHIVVSSSDFNPTTFMYPDDEYYDNETNSLYLVFEQSMTHKSLYENYYDENSEFINEQSKATYTVVSFYPEDLEQYSHVYITTRK